MKLRNIPSHQACALLGLLLSIEATSCDAPPAPGDSPDAPEESRDVEKEESPASSPSYTQAEAPSCKTICERGVRECEYAHAPDSESEIATGITKCTEVCEENELPAQDIACWTSAPCGAFLGRTSSLKVGVCQSQMAYDNRGQNRAKLVEDLKAKLVEATRNCEDGKAPEAPAKAAKKSRAKGKDTPAAKDDAALAQRDLGDIRAEHLRITHQVTSQLYTPFLTTSCKEALAKAAHEAHAKCINGEEDDTKWLESAAEDECA